MTMSAPQSLLSNPKGDDRLSERALTYVATLTRLELHEIVLDAFERAGITQATLAKRLGKRPEQVSRLLGGPGNWTIDTVAELLFAIDGSLARIEQRWPNRELRNASPLTTTSHNSANTEIVVPAGTRRASAYVE